MVFGSESEPSRWRRDELERTCARNLLGATDEIIYFKDLRSRFIWLSRAWGTITGRDPEELLGLTDFDIFGYDHAAAAYADEQEIIATGRPMVNKQERETWPGRPDRWVTSTKLPLRDDQGKIIGTFGISRDVTRLVEAEADASRNAEALRAALAELSRVERQLRTVLDTSPDAITLYDDQLRYRYVNSATEHLLDRPSAQLLGRTDRELGRDDSLLAAWEPALRSALVSGEDATVELSTGSGPGWRGFESRLAAHRESDGAVPTGVVSFTREITELRQIQDELAHQAVHDSVTGLANRVLLLDRLNQTLRHAERHPRQIALLFIDLDGFKEINDTYGHACGDRLLVEVARRLTRLIRQGDTVARFGGDEFVLLLDEVGDGDEVRNIADRIVQCVSEPFFTEGRELCLTGSVGVVVTDNPKSVAEDLLRDADAAMYQAKERGRNRYQFFDPALRERAAARYAVEADLSRALDRAEFRVAYQPLFSLSDERIIGVEALLRWDHPSRGTVQPADFLEIAESRGLIVPIGSWVLGQACRQLVDWTSRRDPALPPLMISVNVSGRQLRASDFAMVVKSALLRYELAPSQLCLEISESTLLEEAAEGLDALHELSELGVRVALDDFGTGYSPLTHLLELPVDTLKIDRSFVGQMEANERGREIVAALTAMAHVLGMRVVAEGIETTGQLAQLRALNCDDGQGYLLGRPMEPAAFEALLRTAD